MGRILFIFVVIFHCSFLIADSIQDCALTTHDGKTRSGEIIERAGGFWIITNGEGQRGWTLNYDLANRIYIYNQDKLFDSIDLHQSVTVDLQKMRTSVSEMQMYLPQSRWWIQNFKREGLGDSLGHQMVSAISLSFSPTADVTNPNDFSVSFIHEKSVLQNTKKRKSQKTSKAVPFSLSFTTMSKEETLEETWWVQSKFPKKITWTLGKRVNALECSKPRVLSKVDLPMTKDKKEASSAKRNFLQLVHAAALVNVIGVKNTDEKNNELGLLLTGICAKHLNSVYLQIEKIIKDKNSKLMKNSQNLRHIGAEFGEAVSVEFKTYQPVLERKYSKSHLIQSYQAHCTDPLGLLIENYTKTLADPPVPKSP